MTAARDVDRWSQPALLGPARAQVRNGLEACAAELDQTGKTGKTGPDHDALRARVLLRLAEIHHLDGRPCLDLLARAGAQAASADRPDLVARVQLRQVRVLAAAGRTASATRLVEVARGVAEARPELQADLLLATAATGHPDARRMWLDALPDLKRPSRDADRLEATVGAADASLAGGDTASARTLYKAALALAHEHADQDAMLMLSLRLGTLLVELGQPDAARAPLEQALDLALVRADTLVVVTAGCLLSGLAVGRADWDAAEAAARVVDGAARTRRAWLAVADAAITTATAHAERDRLPQAVGGLLAAAAELRREGAVGALNLVKARLAELRHSAGATHFDAAMRLAMKR